MSRSTSEDVETFILLGPSYIRWALQTVLDLLLILAALEVWTPPVHANRMKILSKSVAGEAGARLE